MGLANRATRQVFDDIVVKDGVGFAIRLVFVFPGFALGRLQPDRLALTDGQFLNLRAEKLFDGLFVRFPSPGLFVLNLGANFVPDVHETGIVA
jgi:hypothetical protein